MCDESVLSMDHELLKHFLDEQTCLIVVHVKPSFAQIEVEQLYCSRADIATAIHRFDKVFAVLQRDMGQKLWLHIRHTVGHTAIPLELLHLGIWLGMLHIMLLLTWVERLGLGVGVVVIAEGTIVVLVEVV